jgi:hypothetical protein
MMHPSRQELLEEEWFLVRHSGELPEVAFHSALHHLTEDPQGPGLHLDAGEIQALEEAAIARYREILLRDLCYEQRKLPVYRGIKRALFNWQRLTAFCGRQGRDCKDLRDAVAEAFLFLLDKTGQSRGKVEPDPECLSAIPGSSPRCPSLAFVFNCTIDEVLLFARELGISEQQIPGDIHQICPE